MNTINGELERLVGVDRMDAISAKYQRPVRDEVYDMLTTLAWAVFNIEYLEERHQVPQGERWKMPAFGTRVRTLDAYARNKEFLGRDMEVITPAEFTNRQRERMKKERLAAHRRMKSAWHRIPKPPTEKGEPQDPGTAPR